MQNIRYIAVLLLLPMLFFACKKEKKVVTEFKWVANGNKFQYDHYDSSGIKTGSRSFSIFYAEGYYIFQENLDLDSLEVLYFRNITGKYVIKSDGLYASAPIDCDAVGFFVAFFNFMYAPDNPAAGEKIPVYQCQGNMAYNLNILAVSQQVTVPLGTFSTYVMQYQNGDKGYWDPNNGLIMYKTYDQNGNLTGTLKLTGMR